MIYPFLKGKYNMQLDSKQEFSKGFFVLICDMCNIETNNYTTNVEYNKYMSNCSIIRVFNY